MIADWGTTTRGSEFTLGSIQRFSDYYGAARREELGDVFAPRKKLQRKEAGVAEVLTRPLFSFLHAAMSGYYAAWLICVIIGRRVG